MRVCYGDRLYDREWGQEVRISEHFLVALGSALMMIVSQYGFAGILVVIFRIALSCDGITASHPPTAGARAYDGGEPLF